MTSNRYLIAVCLENKTGSIMQILNDWFEKGKSLKDVYFRNFSLDMDNPEIEVEFFKHEAWMAYRMCLLVLTMPLILEASD